MSLQNKKPLLTSPDEHSSAGVSRNISMRKVLYAILACLFFVSAAPVFADGGPEGSAVVSASPPFTPGGNPGQITEEDSVKQSDTNNSMLQYSLSVPDGFGLLEAGDATLYVFNPDTSVLTRLVLPEKDGYQAAGYFPAGDHYLVSGLVFANTDIQSAFTTPDPGFTLSPDQPFAFTSEPADDSIAKSIEVQKKVVAMQQEVKADKERLVSEGVISSSGRDLSIHQETIADSAFGYQPVEEDGSDAETKKKPGIPAGQAVGIVAALGAFVVAVVVLLRKKKNKA